MQLIQFTQDLADPIHQYQSIDTFYRKIIENGSTYDDRFHLY